LIARDQTLVSDFARIRIDVLMWAEACSANSVALIMPEERGGHLKTHHRFERMRLRGLSGARDEFHLAAIVQNLKTLAIRIWRPPPNVPAACAP
jgi:hypothetical protein